MCAVTKNIFFQNYVESFVRKKLSKRLFVLFLHSSFFMFQHYSVGYAMQQTDELVEQQSTRSVVKNRGEGLNPLSHPDEDEENTSFLPITQESPQSWKQNWFVKNIIVECPIIGDFFHDDPSILDSIKRAGKTTCMLAGGSVGMMLHFIPMSEKDDMAAKTAKSSFNMAIGMWIATSTYNTVLSLGRTCYNYIKVEEIKVEESL